MYTCLGRVLYAYVLISFFFMAIEGAVYVSALFVFPYPHFVFLWFRMHAEVVTASIF